MGWKTSKAIVTEEGIQKGLKSLLEERGVNTAKLKKDEMIKIVEEMRDFKFQKTKVEEMILSKGHRVTYICSSPSSIVNLIQLNEYGVMQSNTHALTAITHSLVWRKQLMQH